MKPMRRSSRVTVVTITGVAVTALDTVAAFSLSNPDDNPGALQGNLQARLRQGNIDLDSPANTLALLQLKLHDLLSSKSTSR